MSLLNTKCADDRRYRGNSVLNLDKYRPFQSDIIHVIIGESDMQTCFRKWTHFEIERIDLTFNHNGVRRISFWKIQHCHLFIKRLSERYCSLKENDRSNRCSIAPQEKISSMIASYNVAGDDDFTTYYN